MVGRELMGSLWRPETMAVLLRWTAVTQGPRPAAPESQESLEGSPGHLAPDICLNRQLVKTTKGLRRDMAQSSLPHATPAR